MKTHIIRFMVIILFVSTISCDKTPESQPDIDLPKEALFTISGVNWSPHTIYFMIDSLGSGIGLTATKKSQGVRPNIYLGEENKIDFDLPFDLSQISFPDRFDAEYREVANPNTETKRWIANKTDQLLAYKITQVTKEPGKLYFSGEVDFTVRNSDLIPGTLRIKGTFKNIRVFTNNADRLAYVLGL